MTPPARRDIHGAAVETRSAAVTAVQREACQRPEEPTERTDTGAAARARAHTHTHRHTHPRLTSSSPGLPAG